MAIASFRSKALERLWWKGEAKRIDPAHVQKVTRQLGQLEAAVVPEDMDLPGYRFHALRGEARYSIRVDKNYRITFAWSEAGPDAVDVDYEDYH